MKARGFTEEFRKYIVNLQFRTNRGIYDEEAEATGNSRDEQRMEK